MIKALILTAFIVVGALWVAENKIYIPETESTVADIATVEEVVVENATTDLFGNSEQLEWTHSAECTITHYCSCALCNGRWANQPTSSGAWPVAGRTVAVDKSVIPLGSEVLIGDHVYIAEDTGVSGYWIDVYCDSHQEALNRGMYTTEVCWRCP